MLQWAKKQIRVQLFLFTQAPQKPPFDSEELGRGLRFQKHIVQLCNNEFWCLVKRLRAVAINSASLCHFSDGRLFLSHTHTLCVEGEWASERLLTFQIPCRTDIPPLPSAKPEKRLLMDYSAAGYWWMRFSVIHAACMPEECCLIVKWWMRTEGVVSPNPLVGTSCPPVKRLYQISEPSEKESPDFK